MYAVSNLNYDLVRELINNGANINITDENGWNVFDQLSRKSDVNKDKIKKMEYLLNNPRTSNLHIEDQSNKQFDTTIENQDTDSNLKLEDKNGKELNDMSEKMADRLNRRLEAICYKFPMPNNEIDVFADHMDIRVVHNHKNYFLEYKKTF